LNIALIEPFLTGHRGEYLRWIVRALLLRGHRVFIATLEQSLKHPAAQGSLIEYGKGVSIVTESVPRTFGVSRNLLHMADTTIAFRTVFKRLYHKIRIGAEIDFAFLPFLDYCTYAIAIAGSPFKDTPWGGIVMRPAFHHSAFGISPPRFADPLKQKLFFRLLRNRYLRRVLTIDPTLHKYIAGVESESTERLMFVPDPSDVSRSLSQQHAKMLLDVPVQAPLLLVYGTLSGKKGIIELLHAAQQSSFPSDMHILLAGLQSEEIRMICQSDGTARMRNKGQLHTMDRFLDKTEESTVFSAADMVWIGYRNHFQMSGVLVQAGKMGLPVIACEEGLIGWLTKQHQSGIVVSVSRPDSIARGVRELYDDPDRAKEYGNNGRLAYATHTVEHFSRIIVTALEG